VPQLIRATMWFKCGHVSGFLVHIQHQSGHTKIWTLRIFSCFRSSKLNNCLTHSSTSYANEWCSFLHSFNDIVNNLDYRVYNELTAVNNELEEVWKEEVVAPFNVLHLHLAGWNLSQDSQSLGGDLSWVLPECESEASPLHPTRPVNEWMKNRMRIWVTEWLAKRWTKHLCIWLAGWPNGCLKEWSLAVWQDLQDTGRILD
jgi:hypothetical protein